MIGTDVREGRAPPGERNMLRLVLSLIAALLAGTARAQTPAAFYATHPLTVMVGTSAGGAYDAYGRLVARHLGKHMPGNPQIVSQNMPGAGGLAAANFLYNTAPKDGSYISIFSRSIPLQPIIDATGVKFDALKFNWIASPANDVSIVFSWGSSKFRKIQDAMEREMIIGASAAGADSALFAYVQNNLIGTKFKVVMGYPGAADYVLAIERGELDGSASSSWSNFTGPRADWVTGKKINVLLQLASEGRPDVDAPLVTQFARNDLDRRVLEMIFSRQLLAYPFAAPPGVPEERVAALRAGFAELFRDPDFLAEAQRASLEVKPVEGERIRATLAAAYASPPEVVARARAAVEQGATPVGSK